MGVDGSEWEWMAVGGSGWEWMGALFSITVKEYTMSFRSKVICFCFIYLQVRKITGKMKYEL